MENLNKIYKKSENIVTRVIEKEMILVPIQKEVANLDQFYVLNETGKRIWELIDGKNSVEKIINEITHEFNIKKEKAKKDVIKFIKDLKKLNCLNE
jgi:hypothetical protein